MEPVEPSVTRSELELTEALTLLELGPSHPATHGTVRIVLELSGETVRRADVVIGYLHRGFEKMCERGSWSQVFPYADRLNYVSPMLNNVGFALACEKLLGVRVPERAEWYRMALGELSRITDHLTCCAAMTMDLGAYTPYLWLLRAREMIYDIMEEETGARLTYSFARVGGMAEPPTAHFAENVRAVVPGVRRAVDEVKRLLENNRIFLDRLQGVGIVPAAVAISLGWTGPCLRASGVPYDVRKASPYLRYDEVEFEVPVGTVGDCFDRFFLRLAELEQSVRIVLQSTERLPSAGPMQIDDPRVVFPPKPEVWNTIEGTIRHFKLVMEGLKLPAGEVYSYTEAG
ncbi:MAG TPA: NADH-quinone oxidoreductase subunit D, partial [Polyangiaceae bacterium]|nr:NADH-quinone oxidoreductase subunit D [Polyangiaceae bacterium]